MTRTAPDSSPAGPYGVGLPFPPGNLATRRPPIEVVALKGKGPRRRDADRPRGVDSFHGPGPEFIAATETGGSGR